MLLGIFVDRDEEEYAPHGSDGAEYVEDGWPTARESVFGQYTAQWHGYYRTELRTYRGSKEKKKKKEQSTD